MSERNPRTPRGGPAHCSAFATLILIIFPSILTSLLPSSPHSKQVIMAMATPFFFFFFGRDVFSHLQVSNNRSFFLLFHPKGGLLSRLLRILLFFI